MKSGLNYKSTDFRDLIITEFNHYTKFFQAPLPLYLFSKPSTEESKSDLIKSLQEQNEMGKKLLDLTLNFYKLSENYFNNIENLEAFKQAAVLKIEGLEQTIAEFKMKEKEKFGKIKDLNDFIEHLENKIEEIQEMNANLKTELEEIKKRNEKIIETEGLQVKQLIEFSKADKESFLHTLETLQNALSDKEKLVKVLEGECEVVSKALEQEKKTTDACRASIQMLKSQLHELQLALESEKLKKSTYKQLSRSKTCVFNDKMMEKHKEGIREHEEKSENMFNDLLALEEEQSLAQSSFFSVQVKEKLLSTDLAAFSKEKKENLIVVFPPKPEEKRKIVFGPSYSIIPNIKTSNFSVSPTLNYTFLPPKFPNSLPRQVPKLIYALRTSKQTKTGKLLIPKVLTPKNSSKNIKNRLLSSKPVTLKTETWSQSFITKEEPIKHQDTKPIFPNSESVPPHSELVLSHQDPSLLFFPSKSTNFSKSPIPPTDPVKSYFITLCHKLKSSADYSPKISQIPTSPLFSSLITSKTPLCKWPEAIQLYLCRRLNDS